MSALQAGIGRSDITPAPGTPQGGWGAQTHERGLDAHMPFYATALVLSNSATTCAVVEVDAIGFDEEWTGKILTAITGLTGLARQQVRFSCSHTHAGPNTFRLENISQGADMATAYLESLPNRIAASVWQAQTRLRPARIATSRGTCAINVNRRFRTPEGAMAVGRNWHGNFDPTVRVVRIDDLNQTPIAVLVHYACHPTTLAWDNELFSPDYPGFVRQVVEHQTGATCLFLQGAAGNLTPRRGFVGDLKVCERLGTMLGLEAAKIATEIETVRRCERYLGVMQSGAAIALYADDPCDYPEPPLSMTTRRIELPAGQFGDPDCLEAETERLRQEVARLRHEQASHEEIRAALAKATQAGWRSKRARRYSGLSSIPLEMQCLRFGDTALLSVPGEPFIEISQAIESNSPFRHTLFSGYSNGGFGYIPTREAFAEGGYEIDATPFGPDAADTLIAEGLRLLREVSSPS
jgi:neutral ceramidase